MKQFLLLVFVISSCNMIPPVVEDPKVPTIPPREGIKTAIPNQAWGDYLYDLVSVSELPKLDLPYDETYCPNGLNGNAHNWTQFLASIMYFESSYRADTTHQEPFNDVQGRPIISTGLFQISRESVRALGCKDLISADYDEAQRQLKDPYINMACAVRVMEYYTKKDKRIAYGMRKDTLGLARYFRVLWDDMRPKVKARLLPWCK